MTGARRWVALATLALQAAPVGTAAVATIGHTAFHALEDAAERRVAELRVTAFEPAAAGAVEAGFVHAHDGGAPHSHTPVLDLALLTVQSAPEEEPPAGADAPRLDLHLPPGVEVLAYLPSEFRVPGEPSRAARPDPISLPDTPPPRG